MKVAVYTRVSTNHEEQLNSLQNQRDYYIEYCREKNYELYEIYVDEGLTGTNMKRESFLNMIHDAGLNILKDEYSTRFIKSDRKPKFDYIITKDVSRFARNTNVMEVVKELRNKKVFIHFQNANIDTKDENYQFLLNMFLNFAQQESIDRSSKVIFGLKQRAKNGKFHFGGERLFGYDYSIKEKKINLIENEAEIVKKVFKMYTDDLLGSRQISDILNSEGHTTQNNKIWTANSIVRMLKNEKYTGNVNLLKYSYGDVTAENRQRKTKEQDEWVYKENLIPSIISIDTYQRTKEIMNSRITTDNRGKNTPRNIFSKKLRCGKCGKNYIRSNQKQNGETYYFYACATRRRTKECDNHSITLKRLENELKPYCDGKMYELLVSQKGMLLKMLDSTIISLEIKKKFIDEKRESLCLEIQQKENEINKILDSFVSSNDMVKKAVERKIEDMENDRNKLETELISYSESAIDLEINKKIESKNQILNSTNKRTFTIEEVLSSVDYILINDENIDITFSFEKLLPKGTTGKEFIKENIDEIKLMLTDVKRELNSN